MHHLLSQFAALDDREPLGRKLLLCPDLNLGRELLSAFALARGGWVGWEVVTLRTLAERMALAPRGERRLRLIGELESTAVALQAFDLACENGSIDPALASLSAQSGARQSVAETILELRRGGVTVDELTTLSEPLVRSVGEILGQYDAQLHARHLIDAAGVYRIALEAFDDEAPFVLGNAPMYMLPFVTPNGLPARLLQRLERRGLTILDWNNARATPGDDALMDANTSSRELAPDRAQRRVEFFHAATPSDELLAVLRRVIARGAAFEDVEIACTDPDSYGTALDTICRRTHINATMLDGIPFAASRVGRAFNRWLEWLDTGFDAEVLRRALEAGDLESADAPAAAMARELRSARLGWGRTRIARAAAQLRDVQGLHARLKPYDDEDLIAFTARAERQATVRESLGAFIEALLDAAPVGIESATNAESRCSVRELAAASQRILRYINAQSTADEASLERLSECLTLVTQFESTSLPARTAISLLRTIVGELRAWSEVCTSTRPRRSSGGHVHLTDIAHAGSSGRRLLFIVGLDAQRTAGPVVQSSLLPDSVRIRFPGRLRTTEERRRQRAAQIDRAIHGSSAELTLSYAVASGTEDQENGPAHALLEEWKLSTGNANASYRELREALGTPCNAVPRPDEHPLDSRDFWLQLLEDPAHAGVLRDPSPLLRARSRSLARGLDALDARRNATEASVWHGLVPAAARLDPRVTGRVVSPSSLETFAECPTKWFYRFGLNARAPRDLVYNEAQWLDAATRGNVLHEIYDRVIKDGVHTLDPESPELAQRATMIATAAAERWRLTIPPPSERLYNAELARLQGDAKFFAHDEAVRWQQEPWELRDTELAFGGETPAQITLDDGRQLAIIGRIDRVDALGDGLRIVDYKSGRPFFNWDDRVPLMGGRKMQLGIYAAAAREYYGERVVRAEYRFTTRRAGGRVIEFDEDMLARAVTITSAIVNEIGAGRFLPTFDRQDCDFCDYRSICRTRDDRYGKSVSPRAQWSDQVGRRADAESPDLLRTWRERLP